LTIISISEQNFDFSLKFRFLTIIFIYDQYYILKNNILYNINIGRNGCIHRMYVLFIYKIYPEILNSILIAIIKITTHPKKSIIRYTEIADNISYQNSYSDLVLSGILVSKLWSRNYGLKIVVSKFWSRNCGLKIVVSKLWSRNFGLKILVSKFWSRNFGLKIWSQRRPVKHPGLYFLLCV